MAAAIHAKLVAGLAPVKVYDGEVPDLPTLPYVVLWTAAPKRSSDRLTGVQWNADAGFLTSCVGLTPTQVRLAQDRVHAALLDARLEVAGRNLAGVKHLASPPIYADHDKDPTVFLGADQWSVFSAPG